MPELGEGSTQPVRMTESPADVGMQIAILAERVAGLQQVINEREQAFRRALNLQAGEYERRLNILNHEAQRIAAIQAQSVTSEKFDDYVRTQKEAVDKALAAANASIDAHSGRNQERIEALAGRTEGSFEAADKRAQVTAKASAAERLVLLNGLKAADASALARIERLEADERARLLLAGQAEKTATWAEARGDARTGTVTQWQLALTGFLVSFVIAAVIIIANILNSKP